MKLSKRRRFFEKKIHFTKLYAFDKAIALVKECAIAKFKKSKESIDIAIRLGVDARKSDQVVRGAVVLPNGTGRSVRVAVFSQGDNLEKAQHAGADIVGFEDLAEKIKKGFNDFDLVVATPDSMSLVSQLGRILGPRGMMPNPKVGTVTPDVVSAVKNAKKGQVRYRIDKNGIIHCSIGKVNFSDLALQQNLESLLFDLRKAKPTTAKGTYFRKLVISSTMGPGVGVDFASLNI